MTNQSHTELAAQARRAVKSLEILDMDSTADLLRQCAALESPERVLGGLPEHCTSGNCPCNKCPRATPSPQAEKQPLSEADEALMRANLEALELARSYCGVGHVEATCDAAITALRKRLESSK